MDSRPENGWAVSLGAYVGTLRPGSPCVCCGAVLRAGVRSAVGTAEVGETAKPAGPIIASCAQCGCEVTHVGEANEDPVVAALLETAA